MEKQLYICVCCGQRTMDGKTPGSYEICHNCGWEDDSYQFRHPDFKGGANHLSLNQARKKYFETDHKK